MVNEPGTTTSDVNKFPVADAGGYFQPDNITQSSSGFADMVISRFKIEGVNISLDELDNYKKEGLKVYPNPTSSVLYIWEPSSGFQSIKLLDIQGRVIKEVDAELTNQVGKGYALSLEGIPDGIYIINVNDQFNAKVVKK